VVALATIVPAHAAPPPYKSDRTVEDYSALIASREPLLGADAIKFIPLSSDRSVFLSLGGEMRERSEMIDDPDFGLGDTASDSYLLHRLLAHADLHIGASLRMFAQLGNHEAVGKKRLLPPDEDHLDVQQLFLEAKLADPLKLRLGRQEFAFNAATRFVSFRDGANVRQGFDGIRATYSSGAMRADAFLTRPVRTRTGAFDDGSDREQMFAGIYASRLLRNDQPILFDAFWFQLDRQELSDGALQGKERRHSLGIRVAGRAGRWDWDGEALIQRGRSLGADIRAWAVAFDAGYTLPLPAKPRLGLRFDGGSGDSDGGDSKVGRFHPLFPKAGYLNEANVTSWTNLLSLRPGLTVAPANGLTIEAAAQMKRRETVRDAVFTGISSPIPATFGNRERRIGTAYSVDAIFQASRHLTLRAYYLHHSAGAAIKTAGGTPIEFAMITLGFRF
jgi:hypothetical protein